MGKTNGFEQFLASSPIYMFNMISFNKYLNMYMYKMYQMYNIPLVIKKQDFFVDLWCLMPLSTKY